MFGNIGSGEILLIFLIVLLVFGARRIPEMAQGLGKGIREFRKAMRDVHEEIDVSAAPRNTIAPGAPPNQVPRQSSSVAAPEPEKEKSGTTPA